MALISTLKTIYSSNNPIEITYLNTGATNDPYVKIEIYESINNTVLLYSGIYFNNLDKVIYTDLSPIINGLVNNKDFNINSTDKFYTITSAYTRLNVKLFKSIGGVYTEDIGSGFFVVFSESLLDEDFINVNNSLPTNYIKENQYKNDNYIYSGQGCVGYGLTGVTDYLGDRIPSQTLTNFVYDSSGSDYLKLTKNNASGSVASYVTNYTTTEMLTNFSIGDDIYFHNRINYYSGTNGNVVGDSFTIKLKEYKNSILIGETTKNILCINSDIYLDYSIKHTILSYFDTIKIEIYSTNRINTEIRSTHWYLGKSNYNTFEPNINQIWGHRGQETNGSGRYVLTEFISKDIILNEFNQFYSNPNNVNLPYNIYASKKKKIDTLRYAPLNVQIFNAEYGIPYCSAIVKYYKEDIYHNIDNDINETVELRPWSLLTNNAYGVNNFNIGYKALNSSITLQTLKNANTIMLNMTLSRLSNIKAAFPTYGRTLIFNIKDKGCYNGNVYQLYWLNRRGGIDHIIMGGNNIKSLSSKYEQYKTNWRKATTKSIIGDMSTTVNHRYNVNSEISYQLNTQILSELEYNRLFDVITSPKMWLFDAQTNETFSVDVNDTNFTGKQFRFDKMFNFSIKVARQITNNRTQY